MKRVAGLFLGVLFLGSCINNNDDECVRTCVFTVNAVDANVKGVNRVVLSVFDENLKLQSALPTVLNRSETLKVNADYTVVAWAYSDEVEIPSIALGTHLNNALHTLKTSSFVGYPVAVSVGDHLGGLLSLPQETETRKGASGNPCHIIWVNRKVASLGIVTRHIQSCLQTTDHDFSYVIRETYGSLNFAGKFVGSKVAYHPFSYIDPLNGNLVAPIFGSTRISMS